VGFYDTPGDARGVYVQDNFAYVTDYESGLRIIDVSVPSSPTEVGFYDTPGDARGVYVQGSLAYVADVRGGLIILKYTGGGTTCGDVNGDGKVTAHDASLILKVVVGLLSLGDPNYPYLTLERADVTGNGSVSALDAAWVLQFSVGLRTELLCQQQVGAPALSLEAESKQLAKVIEQIESVSLSKEARQVLENLKLLAVQTVSQTALGEYAPNRYTLCQNFPNPFNPETWIPYQLAQDSTVTISFYNPKGQLVRRLNVGTQQAGVYLGKDKAAYWDGKDKLGQSVASGVYFYTLNAGDFTATRRMLIVK